MPMRKVIVLLSGGIDSSVAAAYLKSKRWEVLPLFINHRQGPLQAERKASDQIVSSLGISRPFEIEVTLDKLKRINKRWLQLGIGTPGRNMTFLSLAIVYAGVMGTDAIALGSAYGSTYPDTSYAFLHLVERVSQCVLDRRIQIFSPFKEERWTSAEIVREGAKLHVPLEKTWSCYLPRRIQCGICVKCRDRKKRFQDSNTKDRTLYSSKGVTGRQLENALAFV
jgi:7-cyano-7-deazaguanine synthase